MNQSHPLRFIPLGQVLPIVRDGDLLLFRRHGLIALAGRGVHSHAAKAAWWGGEGDTEAPLDIASIAKEAVPDVHPPAPADDNAATPPVGSAAGAALSVGSLVTWSLKGAALLGPVGAFAGIAAWLAVRRAKKLLAARLEGPTRVVSVPVAVDSPPPRQQTVPETHYVSVEQDTFAKAHQWASEQVVRKYPGATEILQTQDSLIKQCLAGKNTAEAQRR